LTEKRHQLRNIRLHMLHRGDGGMRDRLDGRRPVRARVDVAPLHTGRFGQGKSTPYVGAHVYLTGHQPRYLKFGCKRKSGRGVFCSAERAAQSMYSTGRDAERLTGGQLCQGTLQ
jgi:hypothetical protein